MKPKTFAEKINKSEEISVRGYLWHISYEKNDLNILQRGLICGNRGAICAHNKINSWFDTYQNNFEAFESLLFYNNIIQPSKEKELEKFNNRLLNGLVVSEYSFWRIDPNIANVSWYLDPLMKEDYKLCNALPINYICSTQDISIDALKLFKLDFESYLAEKPIIKIKEGVTSYIHRQDPMDYLQPQRKSNKYMKWKYNFLNKISNNTYT
jgi:hypothetical protein